MSVCLYNSIIALGQMNHILLSFFFSGKNKQHDILNSNNNVSDNDSVTRQITGQEQQQEMQPALPQCSNHNIYIAHANEVINNTSKKRNSTNKENPGKKRSLNKENWKSIVRKKNRNLGKEYVNKKGQVVPEKVMKTGCGYNCVRNCRVKILNSERSTIFKEFWALGDHNKQIEYITRFAKRVPKKTSYCKLR